MQAVQFFDPSRPPITPSRRISFAPRSAFARAVAARVSDAFAESGAQSGDHRYANWETWTWAAGWTAASLGAYAAVLFAHLPLILSAAAIVIAAAAAFCVVISIGHDATHGSLSARPWINALITFASFGTLGVSGALWRDRHVRLHHRVPNVAGNGIDADAFTLMRLAPDGAWRPVYRWQAFYAPFAYALGLIYVAWAEDFVEFRKARANDASFRTGRALAEFAGTKILHLTLFVAIPAIVLSPSPLMLAGGYLLACAAASLAFVTATIGTHISDIAGYPAPDARGRLPHDWSTHQMLTAVDYAPTSRFVVALAGGANAHAAHHLFPGMSHRHAIWLSRIIAEEAAAHGVPYTKVTFAESLRAHWRLLVALSKPSAAEDVAQLPLAQRHRRA